MPFGDYPARAQERARDIGELSLPARELYDEAVRLGHPDPANATWGEVNILNLSGFGTKLSPEEAGHILRVAEFDHDFRP